MPGIHVLEQELANKIAAGEVVERPGSVIKELVENAIDAGAANITVEIRNGGVTYMRVTDDGCGMNREDARRCFLRHATSKIQTIADLYAIETLGFRGEALAAISAVSRVELTTADGENAATRLVLEGGKEIFCEEVGAPKGTTMVVEDLFFNTPARRNFLKSDRTEGGFIANLLDRLALSNPQIAFKLIQDGKTTLSTGGSGELLDTIYAVFGKDITKGLLQADTTLQQVRVYGYVGEANLTRPNRNFQLLFINDRLVRSQTAFAAIDQAYRNELFHGRHAVCILKIVLPAGLVDVNVHPSKMEVKFSNEKLIFEAVYYAIKGALNRRTLLESTPQAEKQPQPAPVKNIPQAEKQPQPAAATPAPAPVVAALERPQPLEPAANGSADYIVSAPPKSPFRLENKSLLREQVSEPIVIETPPEQQTMTLPEPRKSYRYIGELFSAYLLLESGDRLYLVDKHAAHERMIFERLLRENQSGEKSAQELLVPERVALTPEELSFAQEHQAELERLGFDWSVFGEKQILLRARPVCLTGEAAAEVFSEILSDWMRGGDTTLTERENRALKTVACKAAIKAGNVNDTAELQALAEKLIEEDAVHQCPHGRPVLISYEKKAIEKAFKRI